jgi:putative flippase GtrA
MPTEERLAAPPPPVVSPPSAPPVHMRVRQGMRRPHNWVQLVKFCVVGGSGYVLNLAVFTAAVWALGLHHLLAATLAFVVAVANNFWWNRHWTFGAGEGRASFQAPRFFAVSVGAFLVQAAMLDVLVVLAGVPELLAQAVSVVAATPLNFVGNKMWSFAVRRAEA